ncbi:hypothetical protein Q3V37_11805 [Micromonospora profundi]|uniref:Uncharacterized protein n=1 Tax=Micromonospora profundi TaxID=1420889 RepID=A0AAJ6L076_9ACTN|nr:hypothetical protein [Micromonospora profundi]WLS47849.1 hypothetical protein Q3V37_11805 [Micromonospora profundi]
MAPSLLDAPTEVRPALSDAPTEVRPALFDGRPSLFDAPTEVRPALTDAPTEVRPSLFDAPTMIMGRSDNPTALMTAVRKQSPVFVDPSGRRLSRLRLLAYVAGLLGLIYTALVGVSFAGVVEPHTVLPFVDEVKQSERPAPQTGATAAVPDPSTAAPRTPTVTTAPTAVPALPPSLAPTRSPSVTRPPAATRPPTRDPAGRPTPSRPAPTAPQAPAPTVTAPTENPPSVPDERPEQAVGPRADG